MSFLPLFGVARSPFRLTFPLREAFAHPSWEYARQEVMTGAALGACTVVVGEPGTGKTLLLQVLDQSLRARNFSVKQLQPGNSVAALAETEILLIDEADLFDAAELEKICCLPNSIIMAGLPDLIEQLSSCSRPFRAAKLERLGPEDIARFVRGRLTASEVPLPAFTPEAILALMQQSGGLFRLVTILAGAGFFFADQRGSSEITASDIDEAASLRAGAFEVPEESPSTALVEKPTRPAMKVEASADSERWWSRRRLAVAGWAGLMSAWLGVVSVAIVAASAFPQSPPLQMAESSPSPMMTASVLPGPALQLEVSPVPTPPPPPVAAPSPPLVAGLPPLAEPIASPEAAQAEGGATLSEAVPIDSPQADSRSTERSPMVLVFSGPIVNDTMGQAGTLSLKMTPDPVGARVGAFFQASHGLIGTGVLNGAVGPGGKIKLSGRLMMGRNPFACTLHATLEGGHLVGEATFIRQSNGAAAHSTFALSRL